jgi:hypothetical protein
LVDKVLKISFAKYARKMKDHIKILFGERSSGYVNNTIVASRDYLWNRSDSGKFYPHLSTIYDSMLLQLFYFVSIGDPTVHLTSLVIGSVFFEGLKMTR